MPKKISPKRFAILCHKLAILCDLQIDLIQEINPDEDSELFDFKIHLKNCEKHCEKIVNEVFQVESISKGSYFHELSKKVDTLLRNEYKFFPENQDD